MRAGTGYRNEFQTENCGPLANQAAVSIAHTHTHTRKGKASHNLGVMSTNIYTYMYILTYLRNTQGCRWKEIVDY